MLDGVVTFLRASRKSCGMLKEIHFSGLVDDVAFVNQEDVDETWQKQRFFDKTVFFTLKYWAVKLRYMSVL